MKILFQGDSITDAGRNTSNGSLISIGQGYPFLIDASLSAQYPGKYEFVNRGVSGNRIVDVYARIKADCWNLEPDLLSILIGINDVWHEVGNRNGVDAGRFERVYDMLISDTLERFPATRVMVLEPFVLRASATVAHWGEFYSETLLRAEAARRVAEKYHQIFVPLQAKFDEAAARVSPEYWLGDGVHPMPAGHQLIADAWCEAFMANVAR